MSKLVEQMLDLAASGTAQPIPPRGASARTPATPVLERLRGSLKQGSRDDYRRYLVRQAIVTRDP